MKSETFYYLLVKKPRRAQRSRDFGLRSVGVCAAYPSFDKTFLKFYRGHREKQYLSVLSASWYEKLGFGCFFMFIYEPQFMADSVVNYLVGIDNSE